jgi:hypothetical protein
MLQGHQIWWPGMVLHIFKCPFYFIFILKNAVKPTCVCIQYQQVNMDESDYSSAASLLGLGADYATVNQLDYSKALFLLSKAMVCDLCLELE